MAAGEDHARLRRLLDVGRSLVSELDSEAVLRRILEEARSLTAARYAALGVLDEHRQHLERFLTAGIEPEAHRAIGNLPQGRGVLGVLIEDPRPLRLPRVGAHPQSFGFPPAHPPMASFLGVPILIRGEAWGNLYLTEKQGAQEFTAEDEEAVVILAEWAGTAIENARLYERSELRRSESEQAVRSLEAARDVADAVGDVADLDRVLELVVNRARALVEARDVLIMLRDGEELVVAAGAGGAAATRGHRLPIDGSTSGEVLESGMPERVDDAGTELLIAPRELGIGDARTALLVPMLHRGRTIGVLAAYDRSGGSRPFDEADERLLTTFAASASNAVAIKQSVEADRLRSAIQAADAERARWARELHDQTLQSLGALRVLLASALRRADPAALTSAAEQAIEDVELEIANLRSIITDLRPSLLDDLGLQPALEALIERRRAAGLEIECHFELADSDLADAPLPAELETTVYRIVQEALSNVHKHARAERARVLVAARAKQLLVEVEDDGRGFEPGHRADGFGLVGMQERVFLAGGRIEVSSSERGSLVRALMPRSGPASLAPLGPGRQRPEHPRAAAGTGRRDAKGDRFPGA